MTVYQTPPVWIKQLYKGKLYITQSREIWSVQIGDEHFHGLRSEEQAKWTLGEPNRYETCVTPGYYDNMSDIYYNRTLCLLHLSK